MKNLYYRSLRGLVLLTVISIVGLNCKDNAVSPLSDNTETAVPNSTKNRLLGQPATAGANVIIDDFDSGAGTFTGGGHNSKFEYHESTTIIGGAREIYLRDAASGTLGGATHATIDATAGTLSLYTTGRAAAENQVMYGTAIGTVYRPWAPSPNRGRGTELNLALTMDDAILIEVAATGNTGGVSIVLRSGNGAYNAYTTTVEVGTNVVTLSDFPNMTEAAAADIDGIAFGGLNTFSQFAIQSAGPTNNVFKSEGGDQVRTYDVILADHAYGQNPNDPNSWYQAVCTESGSIGLDAGWNRTPDQYAYDVGNHPWEGSYPFDAAWINAVNTINSNETTDPNGNVGPDGGQNWTRYDVDVKGDAGQTYKLQLIADNCSWVYLDGELVGFQDGFISTYEYGVTTNGQDQILSFIIWDGNGLAGGKFRMETTSTPPPPIQLNNPPVADAGADRTIEATGSTTSVTLDASASSDPDGDALTYSWSNGATDAVTSVELGLGSHTFTVTVTDTEGATDTDEVTINVVDTTAPVITSSQETNMLWPPNHKMVLVATGISASDIVDADVSLAIVVSSSEAANGTGDGNTDDDYQIVANGDGSYNVYLRAERSGNNDGRTYTISVTATDDSGNETTTTMTASVPHDQGGGTKVQTTGKKGRN